jgi:hypothetical protein
MTMHDDGPARADANGFVSGRRFSTSSSPLLASGAVAAAQAAGPLQAGGGALGIGPGLGLGMPMALLNTVGKSERELRVARKRYEDDQRYLYQFRTRVCAANLAALAGKGKKCPHTKVRTTASLPLSLSLSLWWSCECHCC